MLAITLAMATSRARGTVAPWGTAPATAASPASTIAGQLATARAREVPAGIKAATWETIPATASFSNSGQVGDNSCNGDIACQWAVPSWARGPATASRRATRAAVTLAITHATASWNVPTIADRWAMALAMATGPATETAVL